MPETFKKIGASAALSLVGLAVLHGHFTLHHGRTFADATVRSTATASLPEIPALPDLRAVEAQSALAARQAAMAKRQAAIAERQVREARRCMRRQPV